MMIIAMQLARSAIDETLVDGSGPKPKSFSNSSISSGSRGILDPKKLTTDDHKMPRIPK